MDPNEIQQQISILTQQMNYEKMPKQKAKLSKKLERLKLEKEIAIIRHKIDLLNQ